MFIKYVNKLFEKKNSFIFWMKKIINRPLTSQRVEIASENGLNKNQICGYKYKRVNNCHNWRLCMYSIRFIFLFINIILSAVHFNPFNTDTFILFSYLGVCVPMWSCYLFLTILFLRKTSTVKTGQVIFFSHSSLVLYVHSLPFSFIR